MIFTPSKAAGLAIGLGGFALITALDALLLALVRTAPPPLVTFIWLCLILASLPLLTWLAYRCYGLARARYVVSRNALVVEWGARREVIPMRMIGRLRAGADVEGSLRPRGITWPGCGAGWGSLADAGEVEFLAASGKTGLVLIQYPAGWLAISPRDPQQFLETFQQFRGEGIEEQIEPESRAAAFSQWPLWHERLALALILIGGLSVLALTGYLSFIFPRLPAELALHFGPSGQPDRFGPPTGLFILPVIAGLAWLLNTLGGVWLHRRETERAGAYLLFAATLLVQALVWVAATGLLSAA